MIHPTPHLFKIFKHQFTLTSTQPSSWSQRLHLLKFLTELTGLTCRNCTTSIRRHWQTTTLTAPCQRLHHTHPPTLCRMCHLGSADLQPRRLIKLQFRDRLCARTRGVQQLMHARACGARLGSRCWLSALGLRRAAAYHTGSQPTTPNQRPSATANSRPSAYPANTSER